QLAGLRVDQAAVDEHLHHVVLVLLRGAFGELQLRQRGVQVELLVEAHRGGEVRVSGGDALRGGGRTRIGGGSRGGGEEGCGEDEAHARKATRGRRSPKKTEVAGRQAPL